ncbi:MAG: sensor histidine kinase, partial [Bacteroidia bacterium]
MSPSSNNTRDINNAKVNEILEVILAYARLDFTKKTEVIGDGGVFDAIGAGVNMLGEELESSTMSLKEKEYLIKEIHHRVKNNLQIVSSLLTLQSENIKDEYFLELMRATRFRITSMALVHEMMYSTADLARIEFSEYIKKLSKTILKSLSSPGSKIRFKYDITPGRLFDIDRMIPL